MSISILYTLTIYTISIITICKRTVKDSGIAYLPLNYILMIATHLIQQIIDLSVRLTGDEITPQEEKVLQNSSIEELQAIRETLLLALQF